MILNKALFSLPEDEYRRFGTENLIYGSLTKKGITTLCQTLRMFISDTSQIYALDLGCGDGELIYHMQKELEGSVWEGVEISEHRINLQTRDVSIWQGDFLEENLRPYNVLHADNLCLEESQAEKLEQKIANEFKGIYITYRTPQNVSFLRKARFLKTELTETTWILHGIHWYILT